MENKPITVTALTRYLKFKFDHDENLQKVLIRGEISNFKHHSRGHFYFTLKDDKSQISAIMFSSNANMVKFSPKEGDQVLADGYVSVYEPYGKYQLYVTKLAQEGLGELYATYEQLKASLKAEGLFAEERKKPIPSFPKRIGVITSPTGAAIRDIIHITKRRFPLTDIIVFPALVQGEHAKKTIVTQIEKANQDQMVDVLIVGRGGGSIEDLWPFNEEVVARAIDHSVIPVISAVGHETDYTISDFVADVRAPTPSGAAEVVVPDQRELLSGLDDSKRRLQHLIQAKTEVMKHRLKQLRDTGVLSYPARLLSDKKMRFSHLNERLMKTKPTRVIDHHKEKLIHYMQTMHTHMKRQLSDKKHRFDRALETLDHVSPLNIMKKGYAIVRKEDTIQKDISRINSGDIIDVLMHDGVLDCEVKSIKKDD